MYDEVKDLKKHGEIPEQLEIADPEAQKDDGIVFEDTAPAEQNQQKKGLLDFDDSENSDEEEKKESDEEVNVDDI